jgi:hypothetical protein
MTAPLTENPMCDECGATAVWGPAIMRGDLVFSLRRPARHNDVIKAMAEAGVPTPIGHGADIQGFLTRWGFKDRALTARLIRHEGLLTSEDLW